MVVGEIFDDCPGIYRQIVERLHITGWIATESSIRVVYLRN